MHGGVRYLAEWQFGLVTEALEERATLCQNAPHLVHDLAFVVPRYHWWEGPFYGAGLKLYDALAGRRNIGHSRSLSREETIAAIPNVKQDGLLGGVEYHDAQFDDARMALALARTAAAHGASIANRVRCIGFVKEGGQVIGAELRDEESGRVFKTRASAVICTPRSEYTTRRNPSLTARSESSPWPPPQSRPSGTRPCLACELPACPTARQRWPNGAHTSSQAASPR